MEEMDHVDGKWVMTINVLDLCRCWFASANTECLPFDRGTSGIDIDLRRVDIDQCPQKAGNSQLNIFAASDKCKSRTTKVREPVSTFGFCKLVKLDTAPSPRTNFLWLPWNVCALQTLVAASLELPNYSAHNTRNAVEISNMNEW